MVNILGFEYQMVFVATTLQFVVEGQMQLMHIWMGISMLSKTLFYKKQWPDLATVCSFDFYPRPSFVRKNFVAICGFVTYPINSFNAL